MANVTEDGNKTSTQDFFCITGIFEIQLKIILLSFNIPLSVTAFLGNVLIIAALQKPSSLHPPSKLLLGCLATTDLCVGLISQPLRVILLLSPDNSKRCYYTQIASICIVFVFCAASLLTMTAISVDRLLALMLGVRYKHVVTLGRVQVLVFILWFLTIGIAVLLLFNISAVEFTACAMILLCLITAVFCYTKIYIILRRHQAQLNRQGQPPEGRSPLNIARYKKTVTSALWVQITLVACYLPFTITSTISGIAGWNTLDIGSAWEASVVILMLNSSVNPFIYTWKIKEIRHAVKDTLSQAALLFLDLKCLKD